MHMDLLLSCNTFALVGNELCGKGPSAAQTPECLL